MPRPGGRVDYLGGRRSTNARTVSAVRRSAGKNDSIESSLAVTSTAVPKVATVLMKASSPASVRRRRGTAISCPWWPGSSLGSRIAAQLLVQRGERRVAAAQRDLPGEPVEQMGPPLGQVRDPRRQPFGMEAQAQHVHRRLEQVRRHPVHQQPHGPVGGQHLPGVVDHHRWIGVVAVEDQGDRLAHRLHFGIGQLALLIDRRVAGGEQEAVAVAQRHLQALRQLKDHVRTRPRAAGLHEAQVPRGHPGVGGQVHLAQAPPLAPLAQKRAYGGGGAGARHG